MVAARHVAAISEVFLLTSQRTGFLLKINVPLHRQQWFFCNESLPEMNSHSFFGMTVVKSLVYNGRFSVGAFIRENFSTSKRNLFFKEKESPLDTESKSISSLLPKSCHGRELYLYLEIHVHRYICLHVWVLGITDALLVAGDFLRRRSLNCKKTLHAVSRRQSPKAIAKPVFIVLNHGARGLLASSEMSLLSVI